MISKDDSEDIIRKTISLMRIEDIVRSTSHSLHYALLVVKGRFPEGEEAISKDAYFSVIYAVRCLKGRFLLGEEKIKTFKKYSSAVHFRTRYGEPYPSDYYNYYCTKMSELLTDDELVLFKLEF